MNKYEDEKIQRLRKVHVRDVARYEHLSDIELKCLLIQSKAEAIWQFSKLKSIQKDKDASKTLGTISMQIDWLMDNLLERYSTHSEWEEYRRLWGEIS